MEEIAPAILHGEAALVFLPPGLMEKIEFAPVVEFPHDCTFGKGCLVGDGTSRAVFPHAGPVDDK